MEIAGVLQRPEQGLPELTEIIRAREWLLHRIEDIVSVLEAIAAHDSRLDV